MLLAATTASIATSNNVFATYSRNQAASQANACGNGEVPTNVGCQNIDCQIQGDENSCAQVAQQTFPAEEVTPFPPSPPEFECPDESKGI